MKKPFVTLEKAEAIAEQYPTPFHLYDEKGLRENARRVKEAFAWNPGFREYFAVKANPNPFLIDIFREYGFGTDCSSLTELMLSKAMGMRVLATGSRETASEDAPTLREKRLKRGAYSFSWASRRAE